MILTDVNNTHKPSVIWPDEFLIPGHKNTSTDLQASTNFCKIEELATGHTKHFSFSPEKLPSSHVWELIKIDKSGQHKDGGREMVFPVGVVILGHWLLSLTWSVQRSVVIRKWRWRCDVVRN
jgi:hypothetical protein